MHLSFISVVSRSALIRPEMKHCYRVAAFIAVCFAMSEGGLTRREDVVTNETYVFSEPPFECYDNKHENCLVPYLNPYESSLGNDEVRLVFLRNRSNIEDMADSLQAAKTCLQNETEQSYCQNVSTSHSIDDDVEFLADFLASTERIDLLVNFANSKCFSHPQFFQTAASVGYNCVAGLFSDLQDPDIDPCDAVNSLRDCFVEATFYWCGAGADDFVGDVWDYMVHSEHGRFIIGESPIPGYIINMCYGPEQNSVVKRFTRSILHRMKE